jgi:hypothetical protein
MQSTYAATHHAGPAIIRYCRQVSIYTPSEKKFFGFRLGPESATIVPGKEVIYMGYTNHLGLVYGPYGGIGFIQRNDVRKLVFSFRRLFHWLLER